MDLYFIVGLKMRLNIFASAILSTAVVATQQNLSEEGQNLKELAELLQSKVFEEISNGTDGEDVRVQKT